MKYHRANATIAIPAIPPTTPPTIAPTGVACVVTIGRVDCVEEGAEEGAGALREVSTPETDPPEGAMRKKSMMNRLVELAVVTVRLILWVPSASCGVWK